MINKLQYSVDKHEAAKIIGCKPRTLKSYRDSGLLQEGIHWFRINSRKISYNPQLLLDWKVNRYNFVEHEKAIAKFLTIIPSYQQ